MRYAGSLVTALAQCAHGGLQSGSDGVPVGSECSQRTCGWVVEICDQIADEDHEVVPAPELVFAPAFLSNLSANLGDGEGKLGLAAGATDVDLDAFFWYQGEIPDLLAKLARESGE